MEELAIHIADIIKDYRNDDGINIDKNHVLQWVNQFDESDREFLLSELLHITPNSYLSRSEVITTLEDVFQYLTEKYEYETINSFLENARFLNCQHSNKSQSILLDFLDDIAKEKYGASIIETNSNNSKLWIYFDDVLASGNTFRNNICDKIDEYGIDNYTGENVKIICIFFFMHTWGCANVKYTLLKKYSKELVKSIDFHRAIEIVNDPRINYFNQNPKFNHAYPRETEEGRAFIDNIKELLDIDYEMKYEEYAFRPNNIPTRERFYSSPENRIRYENIILKKGIEIINNVRQISAKGTRPLGFTLPTYKTLGMGSHAFTWRNISNTCPLVYWWEVNDWYPLFPVKFRGGN